MTRDPTVVHFSHAFSFLSSFVPNSISLSISHVPLSFFLLLFSSILFRFEHNQPQPASSFGCSTCLLLQPSPVVSSELRFVISSPSLVCFFFFIFVVCFFQLHLPLSFPLAKVFHFLFATRGFLRAFFLLHFCGLSLPSSLPFFALVFYWVFVVMHVFFLTDSYFFLTDFSTLFYVPFLSFCLPGYRRRSILQASFFPFSCCACLFWYYLSLFARS